MVFIGMLLAMMIGVLAYVAYLTVISEAHERRAGKQRSFWPGEERLETKMPTLTRPEVPGNKKL